MKRFTNEKGITLIALIITIVVMLILVAVTINVALNGGIFNRANKASKDTQIQADKDELFSGVASAYDAVTGILGKTELEQELGTNKWTVIDNENETFTCTKKSTNNSFIVDAKTGKITEIASENSQQTQTPQNPQEPEVPQASWVQDGYTVTKGEQTLYVGDVITNYSASGVTAWSVLGAENGKLLIMSTGDAEMLTLKGEGTETTPGFTNAIETLDETCQKYINSAYADSARSVKAEDINRATGFVPSASNSKTGDIMQYGRQVTYSLSNDGTKTLSNDFNSDTTTGKDFYYYTYNSSNSSWTKNQLSEGSSVTLTNDAYLYSFTGDQEEVGIGDFLGNPVYFVFMTQKQMFLVASPYWMANTYVLTDDDGAKFGVGVLLIIVSENTMFESDGTENEQEFGVRPVITLSSDVQLVGNSDDGWTLNK